MSQTTVRKHCAIGRVVISLACVLGISCGCGAGSISVPTTTGQIGVDAAGQFPPASVGVPYTLGRLAAGSSIELFRPFCRGAQFAADLSPSFCAANGQYGRFNPCYDIRAGLVYKAYSLYRLRCYQQAETAELRLAWSGLPPSEGTCWIGVSDWRGGTWRWVQLPEGGVVPVSPATFANAEHQAYAAVVVLGVSPVDLASISCVSTPDGTAPYHLVSRMNSQTTDLMDMEGSTVHSWESARRAGCAVYLLEDGHLLRSYAPLWPTLVVGEAKGLEEFDWEGNLLWSVDLQQADIYSHHDIEPLPNGNILLIATDVLTQDEAILSGRSPALVTSEGLYIDSVVEILPVGDDDFEVVWEWHLTDHLVQDLDPMKANYGIVEEHPELLDINLGNSPDPDFTHANSVDYREDLDQIAITFRYTNEFLIIDHSTTTSEAAGHSGGRYGKGGDFLYRWGNPAAYRAGTVDEKMLYDPHDAEWIPEGYPGAGNMLMFSNGYGRPGSDYSTVCEIVPPLNPDGSYVLQPGSHLPESAAWEFIADPPESLYSLVMSGSQRLPDGNTLIHSSDQNLLLEVTPAGEIAWDYTLEPAGMWESNPFRIDRYYLFAPWLNLTL